jgi:hypothetical protein
MNIQGKQNIAVVAANGIGDGLMFMTLANNLMKNGKKVVFYSSAILDLAQWFPGITIKSFPQKESIFSEFSLYDWVVGQAHSKLDGPPANLNNLFILNKKYLNRNKSLVEALADFSGENLQLKGASLDNGIKVDDKTLLFRKNRRRVLIHPESHAEQKNWPPGKFIRFALKIKNNGWDPVFIVSPSERKKWSLIVNEQFEMPVFNTLLDLGKYIYESGYMVGNDSGVGHFSSNLGIPTLILFSSKGTSASWRPGWGKSLVVTPLFRSSLKAYRNHWWKYGLTLRRVYKNFVKLTKEY